MTIKHNSKDSFGSDSLTLFKCLCYCASGILLFLFMAISLYLIYIGLTDSKVNTVPVIVFTLVSLGFALGFLYISRTLYKSLIRVNHEVDAAFTMGDEDSIFKVGVLKWAKQILNPVSVYYLCAMKNFLTISNTNETFNIVNETGKIVASGQCAGRIHKIKFIQNGEEVLLNLTYSNRGPVIVLSQNGRQLTRLHNQGGQLKKIATCLFFGSGFIFFLGVFSVINVMEIWRFSNNARGTGAWKSFDPFVIWQWQWFGLFGALFFLSILSIFVLYTAFVTLSISNRKNRMFVYV